MFDAAAWRKANREKLRENNRQWRALNPEKARKHSRESAKKWYNTNPNAVAIKRAWRKAHPGHERDVEFGKGAHAHFLIQLAEQRNLCAICNRDQGKLGLDHNHTTGQWRGALCFNCNSALGNFREDIDTLRNAIAYLEKWNNGT